MVCKPSHCFVSTHSRPKAAGKRKRLELRFRHVSTHSRPKAAETRSSVSLCFFMFQHTAARRRLGDHSSHLSRRGRVSTHSRPKAADKGVPFDVVSLDVSTHSRPKAAGQNRGVAMAYPVVSTHSRPKAAASALANTPPARRFQHTAARRRLPTAAGRSRARCRFNTQPPEGGCQAPPA